MRYVFLSMLCAWVSSTSVAQNITVDFSDYKDIPEATREEMKHSKTNFIVKNEDGGYFATLCTRIYDPVAHIKEIVFNSNLDIINNKEVYVYDTRKVSPELNYEKTNPWGRRLGHINNAFYVNNHGTPLYKFVAVGTDGNISEYNNIANGTRYELTQITSGNRKYTIVDGNKIFNLDDGTYRTIPERLPDVVTDDGRCYIFATRPSIEVDTGFVYVKEDLHELFFDKEKWEREIATGKFSGDKDWEYSGCPPTLISFDGNKAIFGVLYSQVKKYKLTGYTGFCTIEFDKTSDTHKIVEKKEFPKPWKHLGENWGKTIAESFALNNGVLIKYEYGFKTPTVFNKHYDYHQAGHLDYHQFIGVNPDGTIASMFDGVKGDEHLITSFAHNGLYYEVTHVENPDKTDKDRYQLLLTWFNLKGKVGERKLTGCNSEKDHFDFIRMAPGCYEIVQLCDGNTKWRYGLMTIK